MKYKWFITWKIQQKHPKNREVWVQRIGLFKRNPLQQNTSRCWWFSSASNAWPPQSLQSNFSHHEFFNCLNGLNWNFWRVHQGNNISGLNQWCFFLLVTHLSATKPCSRKPFSPTNLNHQMAAYWGISWVDNSNIPPKNSSCRGYPLVEWETSNLSGFHFRVSETVSW